MYKTPFRFVMLIILIGASGLSYSQDSYYGTVKSMQAGDAACWTKPL